MYDDTLKAKLLERLIQTEKEKYARLSDNRRTIGNKAQANIAVAGIFIAACFGWLKDFMEAKIELAYFEECGFVVVIVFLLLSVLFSVISLLAGTVPAPKEEEIVGGLSDKSEEELAKNLYSLLSKLGTHLRNVNVELVQYNRKRRYMILCAQILLSVGIILIALISISKIV